MKYNKENREIEKKEKVLRRVYSKILRSVRSHNPIPIVEVEQDRESIQSLALGSDNIILLEIDKEAYSGFVELQKMRDQQKISSNITPRQRADKISHVVAIFCTPVFSILSHSRVKSIVNAVNRYDEDLYDDETEVNNKFLLASSTEGEKTFAKTIDTTILENKIKSLFGQSFSIQQFAEMFNSNELLAIPLILSMLDCEFMMVPKKNKLSFKNLKSLQSLRNLQYTSLVVKSV